MSDDNTKAYLNTANVLSYKGKFYMWAKNCNGFFDLNSLTGNCGLLFQDLHENGTRDRLLYSKCIVYDDYIIVAPYWSKRIACYNTNDNSVDYIDLASPPWFSDACVYNNKIYFWGSKENIALDFKNKSLKNLQNDDHMEINLSCMVGEYVFLTSNCKDEIIRFDLAKNSIEHISIGKCGIKYNMIVCWKDRLILSGDADKLVVWDMETRDTDYINVPTQFGQRKGRIDSSLFCKCDLVGDNIYLSPAKNDCALIYNCNTKRWDELFELKDDERCGSFIYIDKEHQYFISEYLEPQYEVSRVFRVNGSEAIEEENMFVFPDTENMKVGFNESRIYSLNRFIKNIVGG